jgi:hypothetical protein
MELMRNDAISHGDITAVVVPPPIAFANARVCAVCQFKMFMQSAECGHVLDMVLASHYLVEVCKKIRLAMLRLMQINATQLEDARYEIYAFQETIYQAFAEIQTLDVFQNATAASRDILDGNFISIDYWLTAAVIDSTRLYTR